MNRGRKLKFPRLEYPDKPLNLSSPHERRTPERMKIHFSASVCRRAPASIFKSVA